MCISTFIGLPILSYAQNTVIKGKVINNNGDPLSFVNVSLLNTRDSSFIQGTTSKLMELLS